MKASVLIVSRNRKTELQKTLSILEACLKPNHEEILVFLDACTDGSEELQLKFPRVRWYISTKVCGASKARNILYQKANGEILIGFDDDSHPVQKDFVGLTAEIFRQNSKLGIIAFREIKGDYEGDKAIPQELLLEKEDYFTRDFMGCGFAIQKKVYEKTRGFPQWIDIYGEEICVALEVLDLKYDILFTHKISVNHRVKKEERLRLGANYLRFKKQLKNTAYFYLVYYPFPSLMKKIGRLYLVNFKKYALKDLTYFKGWLYSLFVVPLNLTSVLTHRKPVSGKTITKFNSLQNPKY